MTTTTRSDGARVRAATLDDLDALVEIADRSCIKNVVHHYAAGARRVRRAHAVLVPWLLHHVSQPFSDLSQTKQRRGHVELLRFIIKLGFLLKNRNTVVVLPGADGATERIVACTLWIRPGSAPDVWNALRAGLLSPLKFWGFQYLNVSYPSSACRDFPC